MSKYIKLYHAYNLNKYRNNNDIFKLYLKPVVDVSMELLNINIILLIVAILSWSVSKF